VQIVVAPRFNGPPGSGNGGYTCGLVAQALGERAEVTLRRPPPLGRPLDVVRSESRVEVRDGNARVAEAVPASVELDVPEPPSPVDAERAAAAYPGFERHAFPTCFVCGPDRAAGDGLRIFASPVPGRDLVAAPWLPHPSLSDDGERPRREFVWAALDCPGAFAVGFAERGEVLLGRLAATIGAVPRLGERCVVVGWRIGEDRRKLYAGTALFGETGCLYAFARATWIAPR
jgi:hypothetical protein